MGIIRNSSTIKSDDKRKSSCLDMSSQNPFWSSGPFELATEEDNDEISNKNLDSGYAWLILAVMFLLQSSISGSSRVYGIVYAKEVSIGYYDREQASWPIATASTVENLTGILTPALASYLSWRKIELLSTSLFILANLLAYFSTTLTVDIIALGLIQGLALSTCTVLSLVINNDYFERYRTTAYGISMSGSTFGVLYLSPLVSWLLDEYSNFRVVYLALAIVFCVNIFLVLFIKPREKTVKNNNNNNNTKKHLKRSKLSFTKADGDNPSSIDASKQLEWTDDLRKQSIRKISKFESHFERKNSIASISYQVRSRRQSVLFKQCSLAIDSDKPQISNLVFAIDLSKDTSFNGMMSKSKSGIELASVYGEQHVGHKISLSPTKSNPMIVSTNGIPTEDRQRSKLSTAYSLSCFSNNQPCHLRDAQSHEPSYNAHDQRGNFNDMTLDHDDDLAQLNATKLDNSTYGQHDLSSFPTLLLQNKPSNNDKMFLQDVEPKQNNGGFTFDRTVKLLKLPYLHCTWIMLALYYLIARIFVIILVDFADDHGFSLNESTNLLNYWSIGEFCGRVLLGPLIDLQYLSAKNCIVLTCTLLASFIVCLVMVESYIVYAICSMCIAALISLEYMLINVLMVEYLGKEHVTNCYSLAACISSVILFSRPSLIGLFRDHMGSYDGLLILLASLALIFSISFYILEPIMIRKWPKRQL